MEEVVQTTAVEQEVQTQAAPEAPAAINAAPEAPVVEGAEKPVVEAAPEYKPNFKVKSYDKEYEIPEKFRTMMKDAESEKEIRELFEKFYATDTLKEKNNKFRENYEKVNTDYTKLSKSVDELGKYLNNDDFDSFFDKIGVPEAKLQQWMLQKLQMKELPPEQQALYTKKSEYQKQLYQREQELETYKSQLEAIEAEKTQAMVTDIHNKLDTLISSKEVDAIAKAFDSRLGQPGSFKNEVIQRAYLIEQTKGIQLTPEQAVQEVLKIYGAAAPAANPENRVVLPTTEDKKPSLPSVTGKAMSPSSQKITSLDDLKKVRNSVLKQQASQL